jgi:phage gp16-like protein
VNVSKRSDPVRTAELAAIHTARRQLALSEESYRSIVSRFSKARTESSGALTADERRQVIEYFRSIGFGRAKRPSPAMRARETSITVPRR